MLGTGELETTHPIDSCQAPNEIVVHQSCESDVVDDHGQFDRLRNIAVVAMNFIGIERIVEGRYGTDRIGSDPLGMACESDALRCTDGSHMDHHRYTVGHLLYHHFGEPHPLFIGHQKPFAGASCDVESIDLRFDEVVDKNPGSP